MLLIIASLLIRITIMERNCRLCLGQSTQRSIARASTNLNSGSLDFWRFNRVFERTTEGREDAPRYIFYEGPPTANGKPASHHVLARAFKDMFPRYKVMNGFYCLRRGGWDTHGLPVEIAVEKELGFDNKSQIEEYGVAEFNEKCRSTVFRHIIEWEKVHRTYCVLGEYRRRLCHFFQ